MPQPSCRPYLLGIKPPSTQGDCLFHKHPNGEVVGRVEEVADQSDSPPLASCLDGRANRVRAVSFNAQSSHGGMGGRSGASEAAGFDGTVQPVGFNGQDVVCGSWVVIHIDGDHAE
ncbi:hypothetical protein HG530_011805 [Fusarium avenaceum]|nr:hypothetical protein HG530_011805 [Fusarium avenaceum]